MRTRRTATCACVVLTFLAAAVAAAGPTAKEILDATGVQGGLVVHVGCGDGKLTAALRASESYLVHGLDAEAANIRKAREHAGKLGLGGKVSFEQWTRKTLPYADNLVKLLVAEDLGDAPMAEVMRVLTPDGVAYVKSDGKWRKTVKPRPKDIDEWPHYLHGADGNAVAKDTVVGPPRRMQWVAGPLYGRSHEIDTSVCALVSAAGRVFYILDEGLTGITDERLPEQWALYARDAYSGTKLWRRPVPQWGWPQWKKSTLAGKDWTAIRGQRTQSPIAIPRRLVAVGDRVYVTLGYQAPLTALDAATGRTLHTYKGTAGTDEILHADGLLVLSVLPPAKPIKAAAGPKGAEGPTKKKAKKQRKGPSLGQTRPGVIMAMKADTGEMLWKSPPTRIVPLSLAVAGGRVFYHDYEALAAVSLTTGKKLWRTPTRAGGSLFGVSQTFVAHEKAVFLVNPSKLSAFSAETGKPLWTGRGGQRGCTNPPDLFIAAGLVWPGGSSSGFDPVTGKTKRTVKIPRTLITPGHHIRCYRGKATERYIIIPKRGVEFMDITGTNHAKHDWLRPPCRLGSMPCNGLLYIASHQCFCYPGVKLSGFNALAPVAAKKTSAPPGNPLRTGRAGSEISDLESQISENDWPTLRRDAKRSGSTASAVPAKVDRLWQVEIGGRLTQPVAAGGKLLVASVDNHTVHALDARSGKGVWSFTAGGRVDSPPTVHEGRALFGCRDGWVYCLRLTDGELAWRFRAAPEERLVGAFGQLESAWPVHGSVLIMKGVAYFSAGRSCYLDGGIHVFGVDPKTGKKLYQTCLTDPHPDLAENVGRPFDMEGVFSDVLVTDGECLFMQQVVLDARLARRPAPRITNLGDRKFGRHLFATGGLLDGSGWNRTFWMYTERWPGFYIANQAPKTGQMLVFDETTTYGVKCFIRRNRHSPMFFPGREGYLLFADDNENEPVLVDNTGKPKPVQWLPDPNKAIGWTLTSPAVDKDKGTGFTRARPPKWSVWVPIRVRAMVLAGATLFIAGPPDVLDPADPMAAFEGRKGALLRAVSAADGKKIAELKLDSPPTFDGMIAADKRLYLSTRDGRVLCMGEK